MASNVADKVAVGLVCLARLRAHPVLRILQPAGSAAGTTLAHTRAISE
jgi:hypothetical protein